MAQDTSSGLAKDHIDIEWLRTIADMIMQHEPDQIIGPEDNPYMHRWFIIRHPEGNVYLHKFFRSDDDRALHDHPWEARSFVIEGGYWEHLPEGKFWRPAGSWTERVPAEHKHPVEIPEGKTTVTLFITGKRVREWGFHCPKGFVHWRDFTAPGPKGPAQLSKGCPE